MAIKWTRAAINTVNDNNIRNRQGTSRGGAKGLGGRAPSQPHTPVDRMAQPPRAQVKIQLIAPQATLADDSDAFTWGQSITTVRIRRTRSIGVKAQAHRSGSGSEADSTDSSDPIDRLHNQQGLLSESIAETLSEVQASLTALSARVEALARDISQTEIRADGNTRRLAMEVADLGGALAKRIKTVEAVAADLEPNPATRTSPIRQKRDPVVHRQQRPVAWIAAALSAAIAALFAGLWLAPKSVPLAVPAPRPVVATTPIPLPVSPAAVVPVTHPLVHHARKPVHKPLVHRAKVTSAPSPAPTGFASFGPADPAKPASPPTTTPK